MPAAQYADDIAALLKHLKVEQADFFGDSFGGTIAVMMAVRHPQLVRRVVSHGGSFAPYPGTVDDRPRADAEYVIQIFRIIRVNSVSAFLMSISASDRSSKHEKVSPIKGL